MKIFWKNNETPQPPFYAVIFISRKGENQEGYAETDAEMMREAQKQEGFLGYSSLANGGESIFISYWETQANIDAWRNHGGHKKAKSRAPEWYRYYHSMVCRVESSRIFNRFLESLQDRN